MLHLLFNTFQEQVLIFPDVHRHGEIDLWFPPDANMFGMSEGRIICHAMFLLETQLYSVGGKSFCIHILYQEQSLGCRKCPRLSF